MVCWFAYVMFVGSSLLGVGCSFVVCCLLFVVCLLVVCCWLRVGCCVVCGSLCVAL